MARIAKLVKMPRSSIYTHIHKLLKEGAITRENGHYVRGRNGIRYEDSNPTPSAQTVAPNPTPPFYTLTGARFKFSVAAGAIPTTRIIGNGTRVFQRFYGIKDGIKGTAQAYQGKTLLLALRPFDLVPQNIPKVNELLWSYAFEFMRKIGRDLGCTLTMPEAIPDPKSNHAEIPLITGELCRSLAVKRIPRHSVSPTTEVNESPPGAQVETSDILVAHIDATLPSRVITIEKAQTSILTAMERMDARTASMLEKVVQAIQQQTEAFNAMSQSLQQLLNPPPMDTKGDIKGYA